MNDTPTSPISPGDPAPRPPIQPQAAAAPPPPPPGYAPMYAPPPKGKGWIARVLTSLLVSVVILSLLLNVYFAVLIYNLTAGLGEDVLQEGTGKQRVVVLPVVGGIDDTMSRFVRSALRQLDNENPPAAIVLRVESGGGGVTASDQIWHALGEFKAKHPDVPIVASFGGVAASGGYYIAAGADHIVCEPTGFTGSIGVIAQVPTLEGTMRMLGVDWVTQVADGSPEKEEANNLYRTWDDDDRAVLTYLINHAYDRFAEVVREGRSTLDESNIDAVANGAIFTAGDAKENGLIDAVGYLNDAIEEAARRAGLPLGEETRVTIVRQPTGFGVLGLLGRRDAVTPHRLDPTGITPQALRTFLDDFSEVRIAYRWTGH